MNEYHKIPTAWKRDPETNYKTLIEGAWASHELAYLAGNDWIFTEKIDGMNVRVMYDHEAKSVTFGGKSDNTQFPAPLLAALTSMFPPEKFAVGFEDGICLYGEGYGGKIQRPAGMRYREDQSFILFDAKVGDWWLRQDGVTNLARDLGVDLVPVVGVGPLKLAIELTRNGLTCARDGAEGLVMRPAVELFNRQGKRIIAKIKVKDFK